MDCRCGLFVVGVTLLLSTFANTGTFPLFSHPRGLMVVLLTFNYLVFLAGNFQFRKTEQAIKASYSNTEDLLSLRQMLEPRYLMPNTRTWAGSPDLIKLMVDLVFTHQPKTILEIGGGVSSLYLAYALEKEWRRQDLCSGSSWKILQI